MLQVKFNDFAQELLSNNDRISALVSKGHDLLPDHSQNAESISARCDEIEFLWQQLKEKTNSRTQVSSSIFIVLTTVLLQMPL